MAYDTKHLGKGEKVVYYAHKHWIVLFQAALQWILLFIFALVATIVIFIQNPNPAEFWFTAKNIGLIVGLVGLVAGIIGFTFSFLVWKFEQYLITNERIIKIEGIINKNENATALDKVNDVVTNQTLIGRMLGYGFVSIETGNDSVTSLDHLANPHEFKRVMLDAKNQIYGDAKDIAAAEVANRYAPPQNNRALQDDRGYAPPQPQRPQYNQNQGYAPPPVDPRGYAPAPGYAPNNGYGGSQGQPPTTPQQIAEAIQQLARLRDGGVISEAEFQAKKNELMSRM